MSDYDPTRLSKTMAFLLRHRPEVGDLEPDAHGWVPLDDLTVAVSRLMRRHVAEGWVRELVVSSRVTRFEIDGQRIRAVRRTTRSSATVAPRPDITPRRGTVRCTPPDILYHATCTEGVAEARSSGLLSAGPDRFVYLSDNESDAWKVAHRTAKRSEPAVLYVDATRARRHGVQFFRNKRNGLYLSTPVPLVDVLNLQSGFGKQYSAGGFPVAFGKDGQLRVALIQVTRRSGTTWEVAKGKLEPGETPEATAIREVQEEMGIHSPLDVVHYLDTVHYGFLAPGGLPRLKVVFLYLLQPTDPISGFSPASAEGIDAVRWFTPDEAVRAVTHTSLQPVMRTLRDVLREVQQAGTLDAVS